MDKYKIVIVATGDMTEAMRLAANAKIQVLNAGHIVHDATCEVEQPEQPPE